MCVCTVLKTVFVSRAPNKKQKGPSKSLKTHWCTKTSFRGRIHVAIRARCWICHPAMVVLIATKRKKCPGSCNVTVTRSSPKSIKIWPWFFTEAANQQLSNQIQPRTSVISGILRWDVVPFIAGMADLR